MGGKHKQQAQRTKNNVRPSSSSRSAELLGTMVPNFVGFSSGKEIGLPSVLSGFSVKEEFDSNIDPNFLLVLKKMSKKDSKTKIKALNEFATLVASSEESVVVNALSLWPRYYGTLSTDVEHRVREAAQIAHGAVIRKCGRSVAPYLKQLAPVWITSQYDTYPPAAQQAQQALQNVFPVSKLPEVMSFCKVEIMSYVMENLTMHTPNTLSNTKTHTPEECESKYERVIIASLHGLALFVSHLPEANIEWLCINQTKILDGNKFWNYGTSPTPQIRIGCYTVLGCLCQKLSSWFSQHYGKRAVELLMGQLNEKDCTFATAVLENSIILMANIKEWWKYIDVETVVLPGVCDTLGAGGWGSAGRVSPLMLPLLAQLAAQSTNEQLNDIFLDAILKGMEQRCVVSSKSECTAWFSGFAECLKYISVGSNDNRIPSLSRALRLWMMAVARPHLSINPYMPLKLSAVQLSDLAYFWTKQSLSPDTSISHSFSQLLRLFWQNMQYIITSQIEKIVSEESNIKEVTDIHRELLIGMKNCTHVKVKKITRVKFDAEQNLNESVGSATGKLGQSLSNVSQSDAEVKRVYEHELNAVVYDLCAKYLLCAKKCRLSGSILGPLYTFITEFDSVDIYNSMVQIIFKDKPNPKAMDLYSDIFYYWLKEDSMRSQSVVDLTFSIFKYLPDKEQREVLKTFDQLPVSVIKWCISRCLAYPYSSTKAVRDWLHSNTVHESLLVMCNLVVKEGDCHHATLLKMCFAQDNNGDILISTKTCSSIISVLSHSLIDVELIHLDTSASLIHLDMCASFASQLAASACLDEGCEGVKELLLSLFTLNCNVQSGGEMLSHDTWWEVNTSWQDALPTLSWEDLLWFIEHATKIVYDKLIEDDSTVLDLALMNTLVDMSYHIISSCINVECPTGNKLGALWKIISIVLKFDSSDVNLRIKNAYRISAIADVLRGNMDCSVNGNSLIAKEIVESSSLKTSSDIEEIELKKMVRWTLFCTKVIDKILFNSGKNDISESVENDDENEGNQDIPKKRIINLVSRDDIKNILAIFLHNIAVIKTLYKYYQAWCWYGVLLELYASLEETASHAIQSLSVEDYKGVIDYLRTKSDQEGMYWTVSLHMCESQLKYTEKKLNCKGNLKLAMDSFASRLQSTEDINEFLKDETCHYMQIISKDVPNIKNDLNMKVAAIVAMRSVYLAYPVYAGSADEMKAELSECLTSPKKILTNIIDRYYRNKEIMLYNLDFTTSTWESINSDASIVRFLIASIESDGWNLEPHHWDFVTISLSSLIQSLEKSVDAWNMSKISLLGCAVFELLCVVDKFILNIPSECVRQEPSATMKSLPEEWKDIFAPDIYQHLLKIFLAVCKDCSKSSSTLTSRDLFFISSLHEAMNNFEWKHLNSCKETHSHTIDSVTNVCLDVLSFPTHHIIKYAAQRVLKHLAPILIEADKVTGATYTNEEDSLEPMKFSVHKMESALIHLQDCVEAILSPYNVGDDTCILMPHTDGFSMTLGYILLWEVLLDISKEAVAFMQHQYAEFFKDGNYVEHLTCSLIKLLSPEVLKPASSSTNYFKNSPNHLIDVPLKSELIGALSCSCLVQCMGGSASALVRSWWGSLPTRAAQHVDSVVRIHVAPELIHRQLSAINRRHGELANVLIEVHWSVNEVVCTYTIDETKMELNIEFCINHPLGTPKVSCTGSVQNNVPWISMFMSYQNGSLYQATELWLHSIQRKIESSPVCYVCYCRLHPTNGQLPKLLCQTCKNKFHNTCLYKWFGTSNKSSCPMCRNVF